MAPLTYQNQWVELTLENRLVRGGCLRAYKHMVKLTLNPCRTLGSQHKKTVSDLQILTPPCILIANGNNNLMINLTSFYNLYRFTNRMPNLMIVSYKRLSLSLSSLQPQRKIQRHANVIFSLHIHNP